MQDRVSLYPGRVKLTPVAGQENTYDLVRADQPTQEGTALSKANLLTDATASLYGLGTGAVPDEVLAKIKTLIDNGDANANSRARIVTGSYVGTGTGKVSLTFAFEPKLVIVQGTVGGYGNWTVFINPNTNAQAINSGSSAYMMYASWTGNSVSISGESNSKTFFDGTNWTYRYIAIG